MEKTTRSEPTRASSGPPGRWLRRWRIAGVAAGLLVAWTAGAAEAGRVSFALRAGKAEETLKQFARQAGRQVLFPTELVRGVRTNSVRGELTWTEALDQMLAGTGLVGREDGPTGAIAVARRSDEVEKVVELPPYVVEESVTPPWRYAKTSGAEVLSRLSDELTEDLMAQSRRMHQLLAVILPKRLQFALPTPTIYVFFNASGQAEALEELVKRRSGKAESHSSSAGKVEVRAIPNYRFWDPDLLAIFFAIDERQLESQRLMLTPDYVRYMLENRTPTLPRWYVEGFVELYGSVLMTTRPLRGAVGAAPVMLNSTQLEEDITLRPARWISDEETTLARKHPGRARKLLPLEQIFTELPPAANEDPEGRTWASEAALFIRWCVEDTRAGGRRAALEKFVEEASGGAGVSEALFQACFHQNYATATKRLREYRDTAVRTTVKLPPNELADPVTLALQDATDAEIARLKGALSRLEIGYVNEVQPELVESYVEQARRTLRRAYEQGERDVGLLAELGLCECDAGNDVGAEPLLAAALNAGSARPRVAYELARIRYREARDRAFGLPLKAAQLEGVLALLNRARAEAPPMAEVYELLAEVWLREETKLTPVEFATLDEGTRLFARRWRLFYSAAMLNALNGNRARARELTQRGLMFTADERLRARLMKLQELLSGDAGAQKSRDPEAAAKN